MLTEFEINIKKTLKNCVLHNVCSWLNRRQRS